MNPTPRRSHRLPWALAVVITLTCGAVHADDPPPPPDASSPCLDLVREYEASGRAVTLRVAGEGPLMPTRVTFEPRGLAGGDTLFQLNRYEYADAPTREGLDHMRCAVDVLLQERFVWADNGVAEVFDPPLPWLKLPLRPGATWIWKGRIYSDDTRVAAASRDPGTPASAEMSVGAPEPVATPRGDVVAVPVRMRLTLQGFGGPSVIDTTTWLHPDHYEVLKRERRYEQAGRGPDLIQVWTRD